MAKTRRVDVGSVVKGKKDEAKSTPEKAVFKPDYIKVSNDVVLKKGQYLNLETKAERLKSLNEAVQNGKLSPETADKIRENVEKTPDFVRFSVSYIEEL